MSEHRLPDYLDHMQQAATDARSFVEGQAKDDFLADWHAWLERARTIASFQKMMVRQAMAEQPAPSFCQVMATIWPA